jgi:hypothetical protein
MYLCYASTNEIDHAIFPMHKLHHIGSSHCKLDKGFHWNNPTTIICTVGSKDFPMIFFFWYSQWTCLYSCVLYMGRLNGHTPMKSNALSTHAIVHTHWNAYTSSTSSNSPNFHQQHNIALVHIIHIHKKAKKIPIIFIFYSFSYMLSCWHGSKGFVKPNMGTSLTTTF